MSNEAAGTDGSWEDSKWIRHVSVEDRVSACEMRLALGTAIACADIDVQVSNSLVRVTYVSSNIETPFEVSLPHKVCSEDAVVKWHRRSHELWLSLPWASQEDENADDLEQSEVTETPGNAQPEENFFESIREAKLPGGMSPQDLWKLSGALESVSWYKMCPVAQVPVLATGDDSKDSMSGGMFVKLRNSFLDICSDSAPTAQRRAHSENSRQKQDADLPFPQYVHTFHFQRGERCVRTAKTSSPPVVVSDSAARATLPSTSVTSNRKKADTACLDMTSKTKMRAQAQPFTPAGPAPTPAGTNPASTQPVAFGAPWLTSCSTPAPQASGPAPPPAPPPALPPVFAPAPLPRSPPPAMAPEVIPEAVAQKPVPWGYVPYQLPLDKLIPEVELDDEVTRGCSNCDSSTTECNSSLLSDSSSTASVETPSTPQTQCAGRTEEGWRPSLRLLHQDEECSNTENLKAADEYMDEELEDEICADKSSSNLPKGNSWKPTLRTREEAAGLQKQEMDEKFEQALLDRPRYW
eukprot:gnl/MRDRNA2_/MRDRNA2_53503_c0_seq1.p1 gnl/MRDRNA2_/MRDRNA2_53503_c0~~gnl/MRDRNA2_/MRDRNA2_53503_c0_seq1.p1  ORF type:complete len:523 (+),score=110.07 gnl/MRDRNA2_/MRDRNA2_53503_c0_seq1:95-1663(+)